MEIANNTYTPNYPQKINFTDRNNLNSIRDYEDFRNKISADMEAKNYTKEQKLSVNTFLSASMFVASARENYAQNISYWDIEERVKNFENASNSLKVKMLEEQISIIKEPYAIQRGSYMGETESEAHFQARKNQAIDYVKELLQEFKA
ncbi:hypothetical protein LS70_007705 [Helicobacter sp. MIT 11-5569]|uniref:hypothetical protein n=1 Tax=Helicobacter sp. MIT 11-5569 TaxID=1548151 RepID=UPI0010FD0D4D|nr:hypothetical protein [Helicobacter sp. MIT 11-5569]TLD81389.1 hypothetical protein LS70_007705 [Helicobacter sp. MIT 11-5569]